MIKHATYNEHFTDVCNSLLATGKYRHIMEVPRLQKVVINVGVGALAREKKLISIVSRNIELISGQKPVITLARKSISQFKIREGMPVGIKVTLRRNSMFQFVKRLVHLAMVRINGFPGILEKKFDGRGNLSFGISDCSVFYEVPLDNEKAHGLEMAFVTSAKNNTDGIELLKYWGLPIRQVLYVS